jgi:fructose-1,6-bisphosphatase
VGKIYSMNEGNYDMWDPETKAYTDSLKDPSKWGGKPYSARYIGSLVSVCVGDFCCVGALCGKGVVEGDV